MSLSSVSLSSVSLSSVSLLSVSSLAFHVENHAIGCFVLESGHTRVMHDNFYSFDNCVDRQTGLEVVKPPVDRSVRECDYN